LKENAQRSSFNRGVCSRRCIVLHSLNTHPAPTREPTHLWWFRWTLHRLSPLERRGVGIPSARGEKDWRKTRSVIHSTEGCVHGAVLCYIPSPRIQLRPANQHTSDCSSVRFAVCLFFRGEALTSPLWEGKRMKENAQRSSFSRGVCL